MIFENGMANVCFVTIFIFIVMSSEYLQTGWLGIGRWSGRGQDERRHFRDNSFLWNVVDRNQFGSILAVRWANMGHESVWVRSGVMDEPGGSCGAIIWTVMGQGIINWLLNKINPNLLASNRLKSYHPFRKHCRLNRIHPPTPKLVHTFPKYSASPPPPSGPPDARCSPEFLA